MWHCYPGLVSLHAMHSLGSIPGFMLSLCMPHLVNLINHRLFFLQTPLCHMYLLFAKTSHKQLGHPYLTKPSSGLSVQRGGGGGASDAYCGSHVWCHASLLVSRVTAPRSLTHCTECIMSLDPVEHNQTSSPVYISKCRVHLHGSIPDVHEEHSACQMQLECEGCLFMTIRQSRECLMVSPLVHITSNVCETIPTASTFTLMGLTQELGYHGIVIYYITAW